MLNVFFVNLLVSVVRSTLIGYMKSVDDGFLVPSCASGSLTDVERALCVFSADQHNCGVFEPSTLNLRDGHLVCARQCAKHVDAIFRPQLQFSARKDEIVSRLAESLGHAHCRYCRVGCWMLNWLYY